MQAEAQGDGWLGEEEAARLAAMGSPKRRDQFIAGHWLARIMAAEWTGTRPLDWLLIAAASGAPELRWRNTHDRLGMHVSLSHSGENVAVAVASFPVGIDLESLGRERDWLALAELTFAPEEYEQLRPLPAVDRRELFFRFWTLKEASGKRDGSGLRLAEARMRFARECAQPEAIAISWQFDGLCVAVVGERGMRINARGIAANARHRMWQFQASALGLEPSPSRGGRGGDGVG